MILNRDPDDKEPKRLVFENCTFSHCTAEDGPIPDGALEWWCSCAHVTKTEHDATIGDPAAEGREPYRSG